MLADVPAHRVDIKDFDYSPRRVVIHRGGRVTWTDRDSANHTVTFKSARIHGIDNLRKNQHKSIRFTRRGTFKYVCDFHPNMHGTVVVR